MSSNVTRHRMVAGIPMLALVAVVAWSASTRDKPPAPPAAAPSGRFIDHGDGTVTDAQTALMWEQKTGRIGAAVDCQSTRCQDPRNVNNLYKWSTESPDGAGGLFTDYLARLNGTPCPDTAPCTGLGGHTDWRLPTIAELQGIRDETQGDCGSGSGACIHPVFGPTVSAFYWASTHAIDQVRLPTPGQHGTGGAWAVGFGAGEIGDGGAVDGPYARAVRQTQATPAMPEHDDSDHGAHAPHPGAHSHH